MQGSFVSAAETGGDSALAGHNPANGVPTQVNAALFQVAAYDLHELVGQYGDEQVPIGALCFAVEHGAQAQFAFEAAKYRFQIGQPTFRTPPVNK
jgi:hypothetical protein